jgi:hypothetical protein
MFEHWDSFYLLIGGAAGALTGLLFIVATLTRDLDADSALKGASIYMTPVVFHLAVVLAISALATAPGVTSHTAGGLIGLCGIVGLAVSARVIFHLKTGRSFQTAHWSDLWFYGVAAFAADLALTTAAGAVWAAPACAPYALAGALMALLLIAIRNAWDLVTWISAKGAGPTAGPT